jgi:hypothetical protein
MENLTLQHASLRVRHVSPLNIIPPLLHTHLYLHSTHMFFFPEGQMGKAWESFKKKQPF